MKVYSASSSEVFDEYAKVMHRFMEKRAINWVQQVIEGLSSGKALPELLELTGKSTDDLALELSRQGKSAEEIAQTIGQSVDDIKKILLKAVPDAAQVAQEAAQKAKSVPMAQVISQVSNATKNETLSLLDLANSIKNVKNLEGKSLQEISELYQSMRRSRNSLKGTVTQLRNALRQAEQEALLSAADLANQKQLINGAESLLNRSAQEQLVLASKVKELGGQLDEAGNLIRGLEGQVSGLKGEVSGLKGQVKKYEDNLMALTGELELVTKTIQELMQQGVKLTEENQELIKESVKQAELAAYYKQLADAAKQAGQSDTPAAKIAENIAENAGKQSAQAASKVTKQVPEAAPTVTKANEAATQSGKAKANKEVEKEITKNKNIPAGSSSKPLKSKIAEKVVLKITEKLLSSGTAALGMGLFGGMKVLKWAFILGLGGGALYLAWQYLFSSDPETAKQHVQNVQVAERNLITQLKSLKFKDGSSGQQKTNALIQRLSESYKSLGGLISGELTEELTNKTISDLASLENSVEDYLMSKDQIKADLLSPEEDFDKVLTSLNNLESQSALLKNDFIQGTGNVDEVTQPIERGITAPVGKTGPQIEPAQKAPTTIEENYIPQIVEINTGKEKIKLDIGRESRGFRSAAPRMISQVLGTPEGLAFLDPENKWGGWLPKTTIQDEKGNVVQDKASDYLRALEYLYLNKVFNRQDLRQFVRKNLPKAGRKRLSGWNQAIKYYSNSQVNMVNDKKNENFTQKFEKPANYSRFGMKKNADQISKDYYQVALTGLDDQYARSYYTGLKSMYDEKPSKTEADFKQLYEVHKESGADLIGQAHPFTITVADAMGNGGVVENQVEQQRHNKGVAQSVPSGNFRGRHAWIINNLVKLADQADEKGLEDASNIIDAAIVELTS